ncbi:MAG TPA: efflux RND transporter periplasmic adaptor subunit [Stellaceae bacterium]|nr:efflux RND transporter periplasmic adaptor subunit [Stellaceae bacterium]
MSAQSTDRNTFTVARAAESRRPSVGTRVGLGVIALLLATGGGLFGLHRLGDTRATTASAAPPPPTVTVSAPLQRRVAASTTFTGQFSAVNHVEIRAQVGGYLSEIDFTDGQIVHQGDLLFVIDPRPYEIQLQQATAQQQTAAAQLDLANKQLARNAELRRSDVVSADVLDQRVQQQRAAQAAHEQAKAAIRAAQLNLEFSRVTAPITGRISEHRVSVGSLINGGPSAGASTLLTTIVSLDPIHLDFDMSEADYLSYQRFLQAQQSGGEVDRTVEASLSDEKGWPRRGVLDFLDNELDRSSGTIHARATLANGDLLIAPGQFARLRLPMSAPRVALMVPDSALTTDQSRKLVMTVGGDGTVVPKPVEIGALSDGLRVVTSGLTAADQVVINGLVRARPGTKVTPRPGTIAVAARE